MFNELNRRFSVPGLRFEQNHNGLISVVIQTAVCTGELFLQGAHITSWRPVGHEPVLWLSQKSNYEKGKPIRGGVPICFPWFGPNANDPTLPAHGFARLQDWQIVDAQHKDGDAIELLLETTIDPFRLIFQVEFGAELKMTLKTQLPQSAKSSQSYEDALHTYFSVSDVRTISIRGLEPVSFMDKVDHAQLKSATHCPILIESETDRVYVDTLSDCVIEDAQGERAIRVTKLGSASTVVWNPWIDKSKRMSDFGDSEWPSMVCIETANVGDSRIRLSPGESHSTTAVISVQALPATSFTGES
ncbi:MAG: D-hexose-6-phosphate mutarotase [Planctomycetota bacterium]|nr:D-hexose-6-phosphate mutarotase [Planctomycetota bacterium]